MCFHEVKVKKELQGIKVTNFLHICPWLIPYALSHHHSEFTFSAGDPGESPSPYIFQEVSIILHYFPPYYLSMN